MISGGGTGNFLLVPRDLRGLDPRLLWERLGLQKAGCVWEVCLCSSCQWKSLWFIQHVFMKQLLCFGISAITVKKPENPALVEFTLWSSDCNNRQNNKWSMWKTCTTAVEKRQEWGVGSLQWVEGGMRVDRRYVCQVLEYAQDVPQSCLRSILMMPPLCHCLEPPVKLDTSSC